MYSTEDVVTRYLKEQTGEPWHRASSTYIDFKLSTMGARSTLCMVTPHIPKKPNAPHMAPPMYLPKNKQHIYRPQDFFNHHLKKAGETLVKSMPWVKIDVERLPKIKKKWIGHDARSGTTIEVEYELSITGDIKAKPIHSNNKHTIGARSWQHLSWNVSHEFEDFYRTLKVDFNWFNKELSVGCSKLGELGTTSFKVNNDGGLEAEVSPSIMFNQFTLGHLLIESQLGFKIAAKVHIYKDPKPLGEEIIASIVIVTAVIVLIPIEVPAIAVGASLALAGSGAVLAGSS